MGAEDMHVPVPVQAPTAEVARAPGNGPEHIIVEATDADGKVVTEKIEYEVIRG